MERRENSAVLASTFPTVPEVIQDVEVSDRESGGGDEVGLGRGESGEAEKDPDDAARDAAEGKVSRENLVPVHERKLKA